MRQLHGAGDEVRKCHDRLLRRQVANVPSNYRGVFTDRSNRGVKAHVAGPARDGGISGVGNPLLYHFKTPKEDRHKEDDSDAPRPKKAKTVHNVK